LRYVTCFGGQAVNYNKTETAAAAFRPEEGEESEFPETPKTSYQTTLHHTLLDGRLKN